MKLKPVGLLKAWLLLLILVTLSHGLAAQQDKATVLKQSLEANQERLKQHKWVETTVISQKGEEKARVQKQCYYGPNGTVKKDPLTAPPGGSQAKAPGKEITAAMDQAAAVVQMYVPPYGRRIQAAKASGYLSVSPTGPDSYRLDVRNYAKSGDVLSIGVDTARNAIVTISVKSYLESEKDTVALDATYAKLQDGLSYPGNIVLNIPGEKIQVVVQNSNYQRVAPAQPAPAAPAPPIGAPAPPAGASAAALDSLTAPIALYPDALIAQILAASVDLAALQEYAGWLKTNAALKGSELQDAAAKQGFAPCYIALTPFPQVIQMMVDKPDWTKQLGQAFQADQDAVLDSIQRLRAKAMALGNLKSTPEQEVVTETAETGEQVIVIQPTNPQVIYVPVYNTQVIYVQQAPPPPPPGVTVGGAMLVFTAAVIIASSHHHYYGGWRGGAVAYHAAWERREEYYEDRRDYADERRDDAQGNQDQRQGDRQSNQDQRQDGRQTTQPAKPSSAQSGQAKPQSGQQAGQQAKPSSAQSGVAQPQSSRQTAAGTSSAGGQSTAQRSGGSGGFSGYQSGGSAKAQSSRGSSSRSRSASSGGGRKR